MSAKKKRFEEMLAMTKSGRMTEKEHGRLYFEDIDGTRIKLMSDEAPAAIERRLVELANESV